MRLLAGSADTPPSRGMEYSEMRVEEMMPNMEGGGELSTDDLLKSHFTNNHGDGVHLRDKIQWRQFKFHRSGLLNTTELDSVGLRAVIAYGHAVGPDESNN